MSRGDEMQHPSPLGPALAFCTEADLAGYAAAAAAADDPETLMQAGEDAFRDMTRLTVLDGDRVAAAGAAIAVQNAALQLCVSPASSLVDWAWPRAPAVAAALEVCRHVDRSLWGDDIGRAD